RREAPLAAEGQRQPLFEVLRDGVDAIQLQRRVFRDGNTVRRRPAGRAAHLPFAPFHLRDGARIGRARAAGRTGVLAFAVYRLRGGGDDLADAEPLGANDFEDPRRPTGVDVRHLRQLGCETAVRRLVEDDIDPDDRFFDVLEAAHVTLDELRRAGDPV